jgi:importin-4
MYAPDASPPFGRPSIDPYPRLGRYQRASKPVAERSMAVGCAAEVASGLGQGVLPFADGLGTLFFKGLADPEAEVRRNAVYGIGCLCESAGATLAPYVPAAGRA